MQKILLLIILFSAFLFVSKPAYAQVGAFDKVCEASGNAGSVCTQNTDANPITGSGGIFTKAINLITFLTGAASIIIIILGGIKYVASTGDPGKVSSAKDTILYAVIGLVVSVSARGIILFIVNRVK